MKFKAKMFDCNSVGRLHHVVAAVSKYCKNCALKLTEEKLEFILNDKVVSSGISLWCEVGGRGIFIHYTSLRRL